MRFWAASMARHGPSFPPCLDSVNKLLLLPWLSRLFCFLGFLDFIRFLGFLRFLGP